MGRTTIEVHRWKHGTPRAHIFICQYLVCIQFHILLALHSHRISLSLSHARSFAILCVFQERNVLFRHVIFEQSEFSSRLCHFVPDTTFRRKHPSI